MPAAPTTATIAEVQAFISSLSPLDWLLVGITGWSILRGFLRGAIRELFAVLASVAALLTAYWQYTLVADRLGRWIVSAAERNALAFLLVASAMFVVVVLVGRVIRTFAHMVGLGLLDRLAGAGLGVAQAALAGTILITALTAFLPSHAWVERSCLAHYFAAPTRILAHAAPLELQHRILFGISGLATFRNSLP